MSRRGRSSRQRTPEGVFQGNLERAVFGMRPHRVPFASLQNGDNDAAIIHTELEELGQQTLSSRQEHSVRSGCRCAELRARQAVSAVHLRKTSPSQQCQCHPGKTASAPAFPGARRRAAFAQCAVPGSPRDTNPLPCDGWSARHRQPLPATALLPRVTLPPRCLVPCRLRPGAGQRIFDLCERQGPVVPGRRRLPAASRAITLHPGSRFGFECRFRETASPCRRVSVASARARPPAG